MVYEGLDMAESAALAAIAAKYNMYGQIGAAGIGSFASLFGANASSKKQYKYQSALQSQAAKLNYDYSLKSAENMPSSTRQGLEDAGYNPMLAVQNATSGANSSWTSAGQATAPDYAGAISQGVANAQSFQRLKNETNVAESAEDMNYANADKAKAEKAEISARLPFVSKRQRAEISRLEADAQLAEAQKHNLKERLELDRYINDSGLAVTRRGQDKVYNASTFNSTLAHPFARFGHKSWKTGSGSSGRSRDGRTAREIVGW